MSARRPLVRKRQLNFDVLRQPDDVTCGPTCLHGVYRYYRDLVPLPQVIREVDPVDGGGTLAVNLACHALSRGYRAIIYTYNLKVFDPTWFQDVRQIPKKLAEQARVKSSPKLRSATRSYLRFFELGGQLLFRELTGSLLRRHLNRGQPILTGLSSTYLYECAREYQDQYDDVRGEPTGHFVVLSGYDARHRRVTVADPLHDNPRFRSHTYRVDMPRLIGAIFLGALTHDANLLVITPPESPPLARPRSSEKNPHDHRWKPYS